MTIMYVVGFLVLVSIFCITYYFYTLDTYIVKVKKSQIMEFKTSMDLTGLPIITFYQGKEKYNFLLDTGSNISYVNEKANLEVTRTGVKDVFMGAEGKDMDCENIIVKLYRNNNEYDCKAALADLSAAFEELKKSYGVTISGILGCDFMDKYNYCLDFKELVIYIRK